MTTRMPPPRCMATMIGSLPFRDPERAVRLVLEHLDEAPIWPELPGRSLREQMVGAQIEGLPGLVLDEAAGRYWIDTAADRTAGELAAFYERALAAEESGGDLSAFAVGDAHASALAPALRAFAARGTPFPCVKTHCIGPVSMQLQLTDAEERPVYYDEAYQDVVVRQVTLRSRWLVRQVRPHAEAVIAFLDEPSLAAFGSSAYLGVLREDVVARLGAAVRGVQAEGAVVGVHVCGNTDWPMVLDAGVDLLNFDAYEHGDSVLLYAEQVERHLRAGGILAWGIVPTSTAVRDESVAALEERLLDLVDRLASLVLDRDVILAQSMVTPACGLGPMTPDDAETAMGLLAGVARSLQSKVR